MPNKFGSWRLDNYSSSESLEKLDDLIHFLNVAKSSYSIGTPPAELVISVLKEVLYYSISFFGQEHLDILRRNPEIKVFYAPEPFRSSDGIRYIDTGLPKSTKRSRRPRTIFRNEAVQGFLEDFLQDLIDVEEIFIKNESFLGTRELQKVLSSRRRKPAQRQPDSSQLSLMRETLQKRNASISYLRRQLKRVTHK